MPIVRTVEAIRQEVSGMKGDDPNTRAMLAHIRGEDLPPGTVFHTGGPKADFLFSLAWEYLHAQARPDAPGCLPGTLTITGQETRHGLVPRVE